MFVKEENWWIKQKRNFNHFVDDLEPSYNLNYNIVMNKYYKEIKLTKYLNLYYY